MSCRVDTDAFHFWRVQASYIHGVSKNSIAEFDADPSIVLVRVVSKVFGL